VLKTEEYSTLGAIRQGGIYSKLTVDAGFFLPKLLKNHYFPENLLKIAHIRLVTT
jgi:hypothetical protein